MASNRRNAPKGKRVPRKNEGPKCPWCGHVLEPNGVKQVTAKRTVPQRVQKVLASAKPMMDKGTILIKRATIAGRGGLSIGLSRLAKVIQPK